MELRRRKLTGVPLLVAGVGAVGVVGCGTVATSGNLVAPPMYEVCVTVVPPDATVTIDAEPVDADGCLDVYEGSHQLDASAEGYVPYSETINVTENTTYDVVLVEE